MSLVTLNSKNSNSNLKIVVKYLFEKKSINSLMSPRPVYEKKKKIIEIVNTEHFNFLNSASNFIMRFTQR